MYNRRITKERERDRIGKWKHMSHTCALNMKKFKDLEI